ncbi:hypothetical protein [Bacillus paramycoides]|uniref:hypothetical protein n=1 Tax=Bacillus paramycoides TaxID=2026194 RepID=UPI00224468B5|nr:hypothetical protein [Bacillus paramycoides]
MKKLKVLVVIKKTAAQQKEKKSGISIKNFIELIGVTSHAHPVKKIDYPQNDKMRCLVTRGGNFVLRCRKILT